jgi:hypothetical protein
MRSHLIFLLIILILTAQAVSGQYYDTGQDPASLKWMQIKTGRFTVIYPESYGKEGVAYAQSLNKSYSKVGTLFPGKKVNIPVVIHSYTTQSNGYVAWAPRRMELYPTPEQNTIPLSTVEQLTVHELTHVIQMESLNKGFSKALSLVFGEQLTGVTASLLPLWFLEGDAVFAESALTESGRGRTPAFQKQLKAITVEKGKMYKYDKIVNGSYRDYIPDHYQSGYQIVTWAMARYDQQIWNRVLDFTAREPFTVSPVNLSLLKSTGLTKKKLFNETFDTLKTIWTKDVSESNPLEYEELNPVKKGKYINYSSPLFAGTDSIIAIKTSMSHPAEFVLISPAVKSEKWLHTPGDIYPLFISYGNGKLVWVETQVDPRWENRNYSVIRIMDLRTNIVTKLSRKSRYLAATVSQDGRKIAAIENSISNINKLVFIDPETGNVTESVETPDNIFLQHPQWAEGGGKLTFVFLSKAGEGIISYTPASRQWERLADAGREDLQASYLKNDSLFFVSSLSGTDNIYLRTPDNVVTRVTRSKFGATDISFSGGTILFSDYNSSGNRICSIRLEENSEKIIETNHSSSFLINRFNLAEPSGEMSSDTSYKAEPYRKWKHLFKFHSWMPFYADIEEIKSDPASVRPGISIMNQNQLSTLISSVGWEYSAEKKHVIHSQIAWNGWYPVIESRLDYGDDPQIYNTGKNGEVINNPTEIQAGMKFSNTISLPLSFSSGRFSEYFRTSFTSDYRNGYVYLSNDGSYDYGQTILSGRIMFSNYYRQAFRDIYPEWAQTIDLNYIFAPFDKEIYGTLKTLKSSFYFPGFFPDHGIKIRYEKEKQDPGKFMLGNRVSLPRGYKNLFMENVEFISVDYVMPLAYPDFSISSLLFLKRIRTGFFYDYVSGPWSAFYTHTDKGLVRIYNQSGRDLFNSIERESLSSFGFELLADFHILRNPYMISGGFQTAWKNIGETPSVELLFTIDLFGMTLGRRQM